MLDISICHFRAVGSNYVAFILFLILEILLVNNIDPDLMLFWVWVCIVRLWPFLQASR